MSTIGLAAPAWSQLFENRKRGATESGWWAVAPALLATEITNALVVSERRHLLARPFADSTAGRSFGQSGLAGGTGLAGVHACGHGSGPQGLIQRCQRKPLPQRQLEVAGAAGVQVDF